MAKTCMQISQEFALKKSIKIPENYMKSGIISLTEMNPRSALNQLQIVHHIAVSWKRNLENVLMNTQWSCKGVLSDS